MIPQTDIDLAARLRAGGPLKAKIDFPTHPNAPVVVNRLEVRHGKLFHNRNPLRAKYASRENAEWVRDQMNKNSHPIIVWYITEATAA